ncbi:hypothetical protein NA57DRAFT_50723 [Rhizodiscina lignyota]|uniref:Uncharacterized protein n=1 Tax=Rhizodiscina lignyota TaxID=1504668 RepID=A0A9P4MAE1_9PEZI|nr:hypothetical protein NA57DRAFT_50723 [Rhizodiscina lignyota]
MNQRTSLITIESNSLLLHLQTESAKSPSSGRAIPANTFPSQSPTSSSSTPASKMCKLDRHSWSCGHNTTVVKGTCQYVSFANGHQNLFCTHIAHTSGTAEFLIKINFPCPHCLRRPDTVRHEFGAGAEGAYRARIEWDKQLYATLQKQYRVWGQTYHELSWSARNDCRLTDRNEHHIRLVEANDIRLTEGFNIVNKGIAKSLERASDIIRPRFAPSPVPNTEVIRCLETIEAAEAGLDKLSSLVVKLEEAVTARQLLAASADDARLRLSADEVETAGDVLEIARSPIMEQHQELVNARWRWEATLW